MQIKVGDRYVKLVTFDVSNGKPQLMHTSDCLGLREIRTFDIMMANAENHQGDWKSVTYYGDIQKPELDEKLAYMVSVKKTEPRVQDCHVGNPQ